MWPTCPHVVAGHRRKQSPSSRRASRRPRAGRQRAAPRRMASTSLTRYSRRQSHHIAQYRKLVIRLPERQTRDREPGAPIRAQPLRLNRQAQIERWRSRSVDVLVVGGGVTRLSTPALDAAARGMSVARGGAGRLQPRGTSSKSSKMVHGGLRYNRARATCRWCGARCWSASGSAATRLHLGTAAAVRVCPSSSH
ncbi:FAD-dependent oxidoreductase [Nonomuraea dietziae]|uniref:FAD-dependent oxidoreductase n=1 Tax=Nonomuraea dietziae TaxID=65515 RepID=UPI0031DA5D0E